MPEVGGKSGPLIIKDSCLVLLYLFLIFWSLKIDDVICSFKYCTLLLANSNSGNELPLSRLAVFPSFKNCSLSVLGILDSEPVIIKSNGIVFREHILIRPPNSVKFKSKLSFTKSGLSFEPKPNDEK